MRRQNLRRCAQRSGLLKSSARREIKIVRDLVAKGDFEGANRLLKRLSDAGTLKLSPAGTQIRHFEPGAEGVATLIVGADDYSRGLSVRKAYNVDSPFVAQKNIKGVTQLEEKTRLRDALEGEVIPGNLFLRDMRFAEKYHKGLKGTDDLPYEINEFVQGDPTMRLFPAKAKGKQIMDLHHGNLRRVGKQNVIVDALVQDPNAPLYASAAQLREANRLVHVPGEKQRAAQKLIRDKFKGLGGAAPARGTEAPQRLSLEQIRAMNPRLPNTADAIRNARAGARASTATAATDPASAERNMSYAKAFGLGAAGLGAAGLGAYGLHRHLNRD